MERLCAVVCVSMVAGCVTTQSADWPWKDKDRAVVALDPCKQHRCEPGEARETYVRALSFCRAVHNYYERGGRVADGTRVYAGVAGALAGALAPAASEGGAKVLGGLSGVTNAWQAGIDDSVAYALAAKRQAAVATAAAQTAPTDTDWDKPDLVVAKSVRMAFACSVAAGSSDVAAMARLLDDRARAPEPAGPNKDAAAPAAVGASKQK
jgi:hypothetical protein